MYGGGVAGRRQRAALTTYSEHHIRDTFPRLAVTQTFTYLFDNRRAQSSSWQQERNRGTMPSGACEPSDLRCNLLRREQEGREREKEDGDTFACSVTRELDDAYWQPILRKEIHVKEVLMLTRRWSTGSRVMAEALTVAAQEGERGVIVDLMWYGWMFLWKV